MEIRPKLLIVDDEAANLRTLDALLRDKYNIVVAANGEQALKHAVITLPDLILLDIEMPNMDGYEVFAFLKKNELTREIPIIFVSTKACDTDEKKGLEMGAVDYITKPYRPFVIQARIKNHLESKRQYDLLNYLSALDSLTGCSNRRGFETFLNHEWQTAVRFSETIALIFIDIDYFKQYGENHGQIAANKCLKKVAELLRHSLKRKTDLLAHYGENRFACVLSRTSANGAVCVAKRLQSVIAARAIPHGYSAADKHITLSFGVAALNPFGRQITLSHLIVATDKMLQQAKEQGGNQIVVCNDSRPTAPLP
ncbi:MAG: diguanylate cyclase [Methylococcaceae bacterium]